MPLVPKGLPSEATLENAQTDGCRPATSSLSPLRVMPFLFNSARRWLLASLLAASILALIVHQSFISSNPALGSDYIPLLLQSNRDASTAASCSANLTLIRDLDIVDHAFDTFQYAQIQLTPSLVPTQRLPKLRNKKIDAAFPELHKIPVTALTETSPDALLEAEDRVTRSAQKVRVEVPHLPQKKVDASHIIFGIATTVKRLNDSLAAFSHWASGNGARLHAVVEPADGVSQVLERARSMDISLEIDESSAKMDDRYFSHVKYFPGLRNSHTKWQAFIDDDTFFLSMPDLVDMLATHDPSKPQYVGGLSENSDQVGQFGIWAFGGAGVFLSTPLMDELAEVYDPCYEAGFTGDWRVGHCIYNHTDTKLSWENGLHQMDLAMDQSGFYESGRQLPLTLHHWKSWYHLDVVAMTAISAICGMECVLARYFFSDGWILTNGFSVVKHSTDWAEKGGENDRSMEKTWMIFDRNHKKGTGDNFLQSLGPLRERDNQKKAYHLKAAYSEQGPKGVDLVRQYYTSVDLGNVEQGTIIEVCWRR